MLLFEKQTKTKLFVVDRQIKLSLPFTCTSSVVIYDECHGRQHRCQTNEISNWTGMKINNAARVAE